MMSPIPSRKQQARYRVVILIDAFSPITGGGESQMAGLGRALSQRGIPVSVVTRRYSGLPARSDVDGLPVYRLSTPASYDGPSIVQRLMRKLNGVLFQISALRHLALRVPTDQVILVQAGLSLSGLKLPVLGSLARTLSRRTRLVVKPWTRPWQGRTWRPGPAVLRSDEDSSSRVASLLSRFVDRHVDRYVAISDAIFAELAAGDSTAKKVVKIPNGVDTVKFTPSSMEAREQAKKSLSVHGKTVVTYAGTLKQQKALNVLLHAWRIISTSIKDIHLFIVGRKEPYSEFEYLSALTAELGIAGTVTFTGEMQDVRRYLRATDVFVLPSFLEGFSNAMLEAMSCALPVVVTDIPGVREAVVPGVNGIVVPPGDARGLAGGLRNMLSDQTMRGRLGAAARRTIEERYDFGAIAESYGALFAEIFGGGPTR